MKLKISASLLVSLYFGGCTPQPIYQSVMRPSTPVSAKPKPVADTVKVIHPEPTKVAGNFEDQMLAEIQTWIGTPYKFGMAEKTKGTDCSGFVGAIFRKVLTMELPRQAADMYSAGKTITRGELKFGDLVFFQNTYKGARGASHVGIYVGDDRVAHASTTSGVTYSKLSEPYYDKHYLGCRRVINP